MRRRGFLALLGGGALAWPRALEELAAELAERGGADDEWLWERVRAQFLLPPDRIYLNNGTLGPSPRPVVDAVAEHARRVAATHPPGVDWADLKSSVSNLLGGDPDGWVFPRNTTEAMSFVANGLDLSPGDEVVVTDHEHIGGLEPWRLAAARRGVVLRTARLPTPPPSPAALAEAVWSQVGPRTRVVSVSHVTFTTGAVLPVAELGARCAGQGIVMVVDGAHPPGMMEVDVGALGADFYASSPHKWLLAPQGTGLLWMAPRWRGELWPSVASGGWDDLSLGAHRFNHLGTFDESRMAGLLAAVEFLGVLGMDRVEGRVRSLRRRLQAGLAGVPGVAVVTPGDEALSAGMVSFAMDGVDALDLQAHLAESRRVRTRVVGEYGYGWMRLSTHVYNRAEEIDLVLELLAAAARSGVPRRAGGP